MVAPFSMHVVKISILLVVMAIRSDVLEQTKTEGKFECHWNQVISTYSWYGVAVSIWAPLSRKSIQVSVWLPIAAYIIGALKVFFKESTCSNRHIFTKKSNSLSNSIHNIDVSTALDEHLANLSFTFVGT